MERPQAIAMEFPASDTALSFTPPKMPTWLRRRLSGTKSAPVSTVEEIQAKLRDADLRREKFHENLTNKARMKPRGPSQSSSQEDDQGQRLKAKLLAAEEKRLSILNNARMRLAKLDELRQTAKAECEMRFHKECAELGMKVGMRAEQAEANRLNILRAYRQRLATVNERTSQQLMQHVARDRRYKEQVRNAMYQKRTAAQKRRSGLLEAEKNRAHARAMQVHKAANALTHQREIKKSEMEKKLEDRLKKARQKRAEGLMLKGRPSNSVGSNWNTMQEQADNLSRKLARCWRKFKILKKTTAHLVNTYNELNINERSVKAMPFEQFALLMQSAATIRPLKMLLDRIEERYESSPAVGSATSDIEHLLKQAASSKQKQSHRKDISRREEKKTATVRRSSEKATVQLPRYQAKIVLCAYMITGHPDTVINKKWEHEMPLVKTAGTFIYEFELLIKILLNGPMLVSNENSHPISVSRRTFRLQLAAFDAAWCAFLNSFVAWKAKDSTALEEDLIGAACRLELSMRQMCKMTPEGITSQLSYAMSTVQKQVFEDQKLLREKILQLSGDAGIKHLEKALSETRMKFFNAKETRSLITPLSAFISSASSISPSSSSSDKEGEPTAVATERTPAVESVSRDGTNTNEVKNIASSGSILKSPGNSLDMKNAVIVNEYVHGEHIVFSDDPSLPGKYLNYMEKWKGTMENAYWDWIVESVKQDDPDYSHVLKLMTKVRDEIYVMSPQSWKQEVLEDINLESLSRVLNSGSIDFEYLRKILESALSSLQKLCAPVDEDEMKEKHQKYLEELDHTCCTNMSYSSQVVMIMKALRYVLQEIQQLKQEITKARIRMVEPILKGPEALKYLQKSFTDQYGDPSRAVFSLPLTAEWLSSVREKKDVEWFEHKKALSELAKKFENSSTFLPSALQSGGNLSNTSYTSNATKYFETVGSGLECKGDEIDVLVRLGLTRLVMKVDGLTEGQIPETMSFNLARLRSVQSRIQKISVIAISLLVLQHTLFTEKMAPSQSKMESILLISFQRLSGCLDESLSDAGLQDIVDTLGAVVEDECKFSDAEVRSMKEIMARMLSKSLQEESCVFVRVSEAVYLAVRGVVLGETGIQGRRLAEMALQKVGGVLLAEAAVAAGSALAGMAKVSVLVHGGWYANLIKEVAVEVEVEESA
ncbi:uncharacterized protein LOC127255720 [Andrographis paniculata]|uniref:uncharacterized protein LOC127255720 n=1 Tax=Andrographis paniculata TaxID=175694 RepID=UPI0021E813CA|nr:uncharacterized protein LOC127255720 [Andrographis paniculata]